MEKHDSGQERQRSNTEKEQRDVAAKKEIRRLYLVQTQLQSIV